MDYDADLNGPAELLAHEAGNPADAGLPLFPNFETLGAGVPSAVDSAPSYEAITSAGSSLIEESWILDRPQGGCSHQLEHRLMAQEFEGLRLGRELHDSTGQLILALRLSVARLREIGEPGKWDEIFDEISDTACQIDEEIRAFAFLHYPAELGKGGLVAALGTLAREFGKRTGIQVVFGAICDRAIADGAASVALLRVAQEGLRNVHRHAGAKLARLSLVEHDGMVELCVQDDGRGMPPLSSDPLAKGVGLQGMRHRVEALGGKFSIKRLKHGTKLVARLAIGRKLPSALPEPDGRKADNSNHPQ